MKEMFAIGEDKDPRPYFDAFANVILNHAILRVAEHSLIITEIEFYYRTVTTEIHNDTYVHGDRDQLSNECFYFHRQNGGTYRGGTYKGLDITFGNGMDVYGGMLIRSVMLGEEYIEGPCRTVDKILQLAERDSIQELVKPYPLPLSINGSNQIMYIEYAAESRNHRIFKGARVGLTFPKDLDKTKLQYIMRPYRFTTHPNMINKYRDVLALQALKEYSEEDVCTHFEVKKHILTKWVNAMKANRFTLDEIAQKGLDTVDNRCALFALLQ